MKLKKKELNKKDKAQVTQIYMNAKEEWNERFGSYISQAKKWQTAFKFSLALAAISTSGAVYLATQTKLIPYVVEVDRDGKTLEVIQAEKIKVPDERIIKASIYNFMKNFRLITRDTELQKQSITTVFSYLANNSPAYNYVMSYYQNNNPYEIAKSTNTAWINVHQILPLSQKTWRVDWEEIKVNLDGIVISKINYSATMSIMLGAEINTNTILLNPAGFYITAIDFEKDFFKKDKSKIKPENLLEKEELEK